MSKDRNKGNPLTPNDFSLNTVCLPPWDYSPCSDVPSTSSPTIFHTTSQTIINTTMPHLLTSQHLRPLPCGIIKHHHHTKSTLYHRHISQHIHSTITTVPSCNSREHVHPKIVRGLPYPSHIILGLYSSHGPKHISEIQQFISRCDIQISPSVADATG